MTSSMTEALNSLLASAPSDDHDKVLRASNEILKTSPSNATALHCRVVALLKLDRFDDALRTLDDSGDLLAQRCTLERAYALYKTFQLEQSQTVLSVLSEIKEGRGPRHLAAQVAYRAENFEEAQQIYDSLSGSSSALQDEENDLRINQSAIEVQLGWQGRGSMAVVKPPKIRQEDAEAFETAYNAACSFIAQGDFEHASLLLTTARNRCEALDELTDAEKMLEILPIMVQQAYVLLQLGRSSEAALVMKSIDFDRVPEAPTRFALRNNALVAASGDENPYKTRGLLTAASQLSRNERLFGYQASTLHHNRHVADLHAQKSEGVSRSIERMLSGNVMPATTAVTLDLSTLRAAAKTHGRSEAKVLQGLLDKRPLDLGLVLLITQLHFKRGHLGSASETIENFCRKLEHGNSQRNLDVRFAPGIIAILVSLYGLQGRKLAVRAELEKAASHWQHNAVSSDSLKSAAGVALLDSTETTAHATAGQFFKSLLLHSEDDRLAVAGLVASEALIDFEDAHSRSNLLPPTTQLVEGIDAAALESEGVVPYSAVTFRANQRQLALKDESSRRRQKRRPRLPKVIDTSKDVDLERWLPLRDRSSYKPKGKKAKKKALDTTQGGVVREEESLELVGGQGVAKVEKLIGTTAGSKKKKKVKK